MKEIGRVITSKAAPASLAFIMVASVLSACSGGATPVSTTGTSATADSGTPTEISIFTEFSTPEPPAADNPVTKEFEKRTNTKLNITWASPNAWEEKQNVMLASGDMPDLMKIKDMKQTQAINMIKQGAFWDLTPYLKDYKNLSAYPKEIMDSVKVNGKQYILPSVRPLHGSSFFNIRQDWLDNVGLKMPHTMDEFYTALKAFVDKDPDKNGKADTYGYNGKNWEKVIDIFNKSNGKWKEAGGKLVDTDLEQGTRDGLIYLNKMYKDKILPEDFIAMKTTDFENMAKAGKVGVQMDTTEGVFRSTEGAQKLDPKADFVAMNYLESPAGKMVHTGSGFAGLYVIPKKVPEAKMKKILALMDYGASEEGFELACYGLKDIHFKVVDGFKTATEQAVKDSVSQSSFGKIFERFDPYLWAYRVGMPKATFERNKKIVDDRANYGVADVSIGLLSEVDLKMGPDYKKKMDDMKVKVIMGKEPIESWDAMVKTFKTDANYMKMIEEFNKAYQDRKNGK
ncbi:putative aldouronate transport system substrate-binding protein [Paenibacillus sp. V4I3]|uniref:extracellular solute-binding protein n=1 Tax=Paenibacillus sp. V4I3 TaxID=3042305 RepID=UPI0027817D13|nr:extracellular solute-binding protein [Paenibacillus sp. V4I3]MDQ0873572.1 putative aldouronate transport system substrate-binding protein [Paenibacillus sp. V4I3]